MSPLLGEQDTSGSCLALSFALEFFRRPPPAGCRVLLLVLVVSLSSKIMDLSSKTSQIIVHV